LRYLSIDEHLLLFYDHLSIKSWSPAMPDSNIGHLTAFWNRVPTVERKRVRGVIGRTAVSLLLIGGALVADYSAAQSAGISMENCASIDSEFARHTATFKSELQPTAEQQPAFQFFLAAVASAGNRMRAACEGGGSGLMLQMTMMTTASGIMGSVEAAAEKLKPHLTPVQRAKLAKLMQ
jgi:hypothetical protein